MTVRRQFFAYVVDPPVVAVERDPDVARLAMLLIGQHVRVRGAFVSAAGDELGFLADTATEASPAEVDLPPRITLRARLVQHGAHLPPSPRVAVPDPTVLAPRLAEWHSVDITAEGTARVTYSRGMPERLHSAEVAMREGKLQVTVRVGTVPELQGGMFPAVALRESVEVTLPFPVAGGGRTSS